MSSRPLSLLYFLLCFVSLNLVGYSDDWSEPHVGRFANDTAPYPPAPDPGAAAEVVDQNEAVSVRLRIAGLPLNVDGTSAKHVFSTSLYMHRIT